VAGSRATADALVVLEAGARFAADTYWPVIRTSYETEEAPPRPYTRFADIVSPTADDEFRRAELVESLQNADEALPLYRRAALQGHAAATLALGRLLLGRMDPSGVALIEEAMTRDEDLVPAGCGVLAGYYTKRHEDLLARKCEWRAARHATDAHLASR
jgi:hypothetical protein